MKWSLSIAVLFLFCISGFCASRIGTESLLSITNSVSWRQHIGFGPASNSVQNLNPPIFRWPYLSDVTRSAVDPGLVQTFMFKVGYTNDLSAPVFSVTCSNNFYNFLAPFTNTDGSTYTNAIYWQITYLNSNATLTISNSPLYNFQLLATASNWDRSMLADFTYISNSCSVHPHLYFRITNRADVLQWCKTSWWEADWVVMSNTAFQTITQHWWNTDDQTNHYEWPQRSAEVALVWNLTTNTTLLSANPMLSASSWASNFLLLNYDKTDPENIHETGSQCLPLMYDMLYNQFTATERSNILYVMEVQCKFYLYKNWWYDSTDTDRTYPGPFHLNLTSAAKRGGSHEGESYWLGLFTCLSALGESAFMREFFQYAGNYSIGQHYQYGEDTGSMNQGRGYFDKAILYTTESAGLMMMTFPEAKLWSNPRWRGQGIFMSFLNPLYFKEVNEPWGDLGGGYIIFWQDAMRDIALISRDKSLWQHYTNAYSIRDRYVAPANFIHLWTPYHFPFVGLETNTSTAFLDPDGGWAISMDKAPNQFDAFTNGVGFITHARPRGSEVNHSEFTDGEVQMWAYGANVTEGGVGNYRKHPQNHNTLLVNGIGQCLPNTPMHDYYARLSAWTNTDGFTYVGMDLTRAYNRSNFTIGGYGLQSDFVTMYSTNRQPQISKVERHILFARKKYWVVYDVLTATTNSIFSWKWNILEDTAIVDTNNCAFTYTCTNNYNGSNVTVFVKHIVDPSTMSLTNLHGTNLTRANPITGEDYNSTDGDAADLRWWNNIWVSTKIPTNNWHFLSVIYPTKWMGVPPSITRIDDYTVAVTNGAEGDVITFATNTPEYTIMVDLANAGGSYSVPSRLQATTARAQRITGR